MPNDSNDNVPRDAGARRDYWRTHDEYYSATKTLGEQLLKAKPDQLLEWLTREPMNLRNRVGLTVQWGLSMNLVGFEADSGLAYARQDFEDVDPEALKSWGEDIDDPAELRETYEGHGEPVFRTHNGLRAFMDLEYALTTGYGQSIALAHMEELLGDAVDQEFTPLTGIPDDLEVEYARSLLPAVGIIAEERIPHEVSIAPKTRRVPQRVWDDFAPIVAIMKQTIDGTSINRPWWQIELVRQFRAPLRGESAKEVVDNLLSILKHAEAPDVFSRRDPTHVARAQAFVRSAQVDVQDNGLDNGTPIYVPERARRGRPMKPWKAAAEFARCFGYSIPDRERDAKRRK